MLAFRKDRRGFGLGNEMMRSCVSRQSSLIQFIYWFAKERIATLVFQNPKEIDFERM